VVSTVETPFLRMSLDQDSGTLSGEVVAGPFAGHPLSHLSFGDIMALRQFCGADPASVQLLETWLDRTWPDWRVKEGAPPSADEQDSGAMTRREALSILGLREEVNHDEIKAAYRRLIGLAHPDHGGTDYLAAKINRARDVLLDS
jgi:hypothetical protein